MRTYRVGPSVRDRGGSGAVGLLISVDLSDDEEEEEKLNNLG